MDRQKDLREGRRVGRQAGSLLVVAVGSREGRSLADRACLQQSR